MIETARLRLRPPRPDDAPALSALMTPAVSRWMASWPVPFTPELAEARIAAVLDAMAGGGTICVVIEHGAAVAGWIGAARLPGTSRASFGYWLGEPWHGQALMGEAAPAFVAALRDRLALDSIEATCQPENHRSARVLAACAASAPACSTPRPATATNRSISGSATGRATCQTKFLTNLNWGDPSRICYLNCGQPDNPEPRKPRPGPSPVSNVK